MARSARLLETTVALGVFGLWVSACRDVPKAVEPEVPEPPRDLGTRTYTVAHALASKLPDHEAGGDYSWSPAGTATILFGETAAKVEGSGAAVAGRKVTVKTGGTYRVRGTSGDGQLVVDAEGKGVVRLVLEGVDLTNPRGPALWVSGADKVVVILAEASSNRLADGSPYAGAGEANGVVFSSDDLSIAGSGCLVVEGRYQDGIVSKDGLVIRGGKLVVRAPDDGIRGQDYVVVRGGIVAVTAGGDGIKTDNRTNAKAGYFLVQEGTLTIQAGGDAVQADTDALLAGGELILSAGGGSSVRVPPTLSAKGIKGGWGIVVDGGVVSVDAAEDGLHSDGFMVVNGGDLTVAAGDDGMHADGELVINGGNVRILKSYEGIENTKADLTLNGGTIRLVASDDGINLAGDGEGIPGMGGGGAGGGRYTLYLNGGYIVSDALGDGVDANGSIWMRGGSLLVHGPTSNFNGALDYGTGTFRMDGGFLVAVGSSGMAQGPGSGSSQPSVLLNLVAGRPAGTPVHIESASGEELLTFVPRRAFQSVAFSSDKLKLGTTYHAFLGGTVRGSEEDGLYPEGAYSPGILLTPFTLTAVAVRLTR